jgi:hypothetical protein
MSTTFKEFLQEQAKKHQAEAQAGQATVDEWHAAVKRLFSEMRAWLKESDPDGFIEVKEGEQKITEPGLGEYRVPRLDLHAFGKWVGIIPKARGTVSAAHPPQKAAPGRAIGRVDITDELRRYVLYRVQENGREAWVIDDLPPEKAWPGQIQYIPRSEPKPLDKDAFEKALMSYLR